ncbi:pyridoxamine 5'-phosphate oxidase family protein [Catellatospora sp. NPDC049609]|uniref:pyridoxamine 5'-phosphate oxidase family protein n=1 Tax=Catellatospora sp. NPDC049609 TaxID=3155505 RepID=UPI0034481E27
MTSIAVVHGSTGERRLQAEHGTAERAQRFYDQQVLDQLNDRMVAFVRAQEMVFVATSDAGGECDATFRAGPAGFVHVADPGRLMWPEYRGNGVMASLGNISENAHVGLLFMDFVRDVIGLHVNGRATIMDDAQARAECPELPVDPVPGRRAERWVVVEVEEAYIHCAKHIPRMVKAPRDRAWGTDDVRRKGGDFFGAASAAGPALPGVVHGGAGDGEKQHGEQPEVAFPTEQPVVAEQVAQHPDPEREQGRDQQQGGGNGHRWVHLVHRMLRLPWRAAAPLDHTPDPSGPVRGRRGG